MESETEECPGDWRTLDVVEMPIGATLVYPTARTLLADGTALEGRGVIPDVVVALRRADLAAGRDTQLEAAIHRLGGLHARGGGALGRCP